MVKGWWAGILLAMVFFLLLLSTSCGSGLPDGHPDKYPYPSNPPGGGPVYTEQSSLVRGEWVGVAGVLATVGAFAAWVKFGGMSEPFTVQPAGYGASPVVVYARTKRHAARTAKSKRGMRHHNQFDVWTRDEVEGGGVEPTRIDL